MRMWSRQPILFRLRPMLKNFLIRDTTKSSCKTQNVCKKERSGRVYVTVCIAFFNAYLSDQVALAGK